MLTQVPTEEPSPIAPERSARPLIRYGLIALIFAPGLLLLGLVYLYGVNVPYWDEWDNSVWLHTKYLDGTLRLGDFLHYQNESRPPLPRAIDLIIEIATGGNRRIEMFVSVLVMGFAVLSIYLLAQRTVPKQALPLTAAASWLMFSTVQYENWLWGEQVILILPIALLLFGLVIVYSDLPTSLKTAAAILIGISCVLCFVIGFAAFLLLGVVQLLTAREKRGAFLVLLLTWVTAFAVTARLYTLSSSPYAKPPLTEVLWLAPDLSALYLAVFFGSPFASHEPPLYWLIPLGAFVIVASMIPLLRLRGRLKPALPWLAVLAFSMLFALLTLVGRIDLGIQQAMTSRYASFSLLLPLATMFLWAVTYTRWSKFVGGMSVMLGGLLFAAQVWMSVTTVTDMRETWRKRSAAKAELVFINVHNDEESNRILGEIYPDRERLRAVANEYAAHGMLAPLAKP